MRSTNLSVYLEHLRCFAKRRSTPIRPLTLLVGENSSGKSTFLAAAAYAFDPARFPARPGFNDPPFHLGSFESVATFKAGKYGGDESFSLGYSRGTRETESYQQMVATYESDQGSVRLKQFDAESGHATCTITVEDRTATLALSFNGSSKSGNIQTEPSPQIYQTLMASGVATAILHAGFEGPKAGSKDLRGFTSQVFQFREAIAPPFRDVVSIAPIRSRPRRTYDELGDEFDPEGEHVPKVLARLFSNKTTDQTALRVRKALMGFGKESGLYDDVTVKKLGKETGAPFQIQVSVGGPKVNLLDVGYGVSQALPIIVQSTLRNDNNLLLIQQPEVHLHPRAQAALGTFFVETVKAGQDTFLVETHSDYLVDRVRIEVARGKISPDQVLILFFHRPRLESTIHPITLDRHGNVHNAPAHYRHFFLKEQMRLFDDVGA